MKQFYSYVQQLVSVFHLTQRATVILQYNTQAEEMVGLHSIRMTASIVRFLTNSL